MMFDRLTLRERGQRPHEGCGWNSGQACEHTYIRSGHIMLGDFDGVIAIPSWAAAECLEAAREVHRIEELQRAEFLGGDDSATVYGRYNRFGHIKRWKD